MDKQLIILDEIGTRLKNITLANGYRMDLLKISRSRLKPFKNGDLPAVNYWPSRDQLDSKTGSSETRLLPVTMEVYSTTRDEPFVDVAIRLGNDIAVALTRATSAPKVTDQLSRSLGGLVNSLVIDSITPFIGEGQSPWCGAIVEINIKFKTDLGVFN